MSNVILRRAIGFRLQSPSEVVDMGLAKQALSVIQPGAELTPEELKARKDRIDGIFARAEETTKDGTAIEENVRKTAEKEARGIWSDFAGKNGVWELHQRTREKLESIATHIHNIAKACCLAALERAKEDESADVGKLAGNFFRNSVAIAELEIRRIASPSTDEQFEMLDTFFASTWKTYKSRTQTAIGKGFNANDFDGLGEFMNADKAANSNQSQQGNANGGPGRGTQTESQVKTAIMDTAAAVAPETGKVQGAVSQLLIALKAADTEKHEDKIVQILNFALGEIKKLPGKPSGVKTMKGSAVPASKVAQA